MPSKPPETTALSKDASSDIFYQWYESPIGRLLLTGSEQALYSITLPNQNAIAADQWQQSNNVFKEACKQLDAYFRRDLETFDIPLSPNGTAFQKSVWKALQTIPYGKTTSYGAVAKLVDNPKAGRAVGGANGRNPIPIIIPCHRVIGGNGSLTGFAGGLPAKTFLLDLENTEQLSFQF